MSDVAGPPTPSPADLVKVVALDGPAGSGKSTVARRVAQALGWRFVDTGATYRAVTLAALRSGVPLGDGEAVLAAARAARIELSTDPAHAFVRLDDTDVTAEIRGPAVTSQVSAVSAFPAVRELLVDLQRQAMGTQGAVVEGRDIATVVAPQAAVKVYLDAEPAVRARRRAGEATSTGLTSAELESAVAEAISARDALDHQTNRLEVSDGAVHLDTTHMTLDQVVGAIVRLVEAAGLART